MPKRKREKLDGREWLSLEARNGDRRMGMEEGLTSFGCTLSSSRVLFASSSLPPKMSR